MNIELYKSKALSKATAARILLAVVFVFGWQTTVKAVSITECTSGKFCYCVNSELIETINQRVKYIRGMVADQKRHGKSIGYMSIPISTIGGSYFSVNTVVAAEVKQYVENRLGPEDAWIINPASKDVALPPGATGADYMLMWTKVLEGDNGLGDDFDFVYFVGPSAFARHFSLDGQRDMEIISKYYDELSKKDTELRKVDKKSFREYYSLRASVSFSYGSHDEWNIVRAINERRRADTKYGLTKQLAVLFDGHAVPPGQFESAIASGNTGECPQK
jgi:hypothetical protein